MKGPTNQKRRGLVLNCEMNITCEFGHLRGNKSHPFSVQFLPDKEFVTRVFFAWYHAKERSLFRRFFWLLHLSLSACLCFRHWARLAITEASSCCLCKRVTIGPATSFFLGVSTVNVSLFWLALEKKLTEDIETKIYFYFANLDLHNRLKSSSSHCKMSHILLYFLITGDWVNFVVREWNILYL